ncbi:hypothetical protein EC396_01475 [Lutibacter sp. HS1-25]|uniref:hypothetical protein n=1 Tax=Lutibacter sp. HS1-25 TaxID=2485000 RepID=UPI0010117217|nr:hypothetical protein [Lutibacter sp. HS1-25]RXP63503.1 hypothetical protein EC396_01475 [Lutibacter sp. HS1-25]
MVDYEKIKIDLKKEEQDLLDEIIELQKKMKDADPSKMNGQMMNAIQSKSIETITMALGISDILENSNHSTNGLAFDKEFKAKTKWENTPKSERSLEYKVKYTNKDEFNRMLKEGDNLKYNYSEHRESLTGKEFAKNRQKMYNENGGGYDCAYTGKHLLNGEKDETKQYSYEHVTSIKEIHEDKVLAFTTTLEERKKLANSKENLVATNKKLNTSLNDTKIDDVEDYKNKTSTNDSNKTNKEHFEIDDEKMSKTIDVSKKAREHLLKSKQVQYAVKTQAKIATSNAVKSGAKAAIGQLLSITIVEVINEYKKEEDIEITQRVKNISFRIKEKAKGLLSTFKDHSISSFLSTFLDAILNSLFKIAKNIFKFVKLAIVSILKAVKILFSSEYSWEVRLKEALKILGVAVASLIGLGLDEIIEKALITNFPFTTPFAGYVSPVLSGLIVGIGSVLILQGFQKYQSKIVFNKLQGEEGSKLQTRSEINLAQAGISDVEATKYTSLSLTIFQGTLPIIESCKNQIDESLVKIRKTKNIISENISSAKAINNENDNLLNLLESI